MKCGAIVSIVILNNESVLMIKEGKEGDSYGMWNIPSGRLEEDETVIEGAIREAKEETGLDISGKYITGVYNYRSASGMPLIRFNFLEEYTGGDVVIDNEEIIGYKWMKLGDVLEMDYNLIWNATSVKRILKDVKNGKKVDSNIIVNI